MKIPFVTGYAEQTQMNERALEPAMVMKPFALDALALKVRAVPGA